MFDARGQEEVFSQPHIFTVGTSWAAAVVFLTPAMRWMRNTLQRFLAAEKGKSWLIISSSRGEAEREQV